MGEGDGWQAVANRIGGAVTMSRPQLSRGGGGGFYINPKTSQLETAGYLGKWRKNCQSMLSGKSDGTTAIKI